MPFSPQQQEVLFTRLDAIGSTLLICDAADDADFSGLRRQLQELTGSAEGIAEQEQFQQILTTILQTVSAAAPEDRQQQLSVAVAVLQQCVRNEWACLTVARVRSRLNGKVESLPRNTAAGSGFAPEQLRLLPEFIGNCRSLLQCIEQDTLDLERDRQDQQKIHSLFRGFHTLKGESGLLGLRNIHLLSHEAESLLEPVRNTHLGISGETTALLLEISDRVQEVLDRLDRNPDDGVNYSIEAFLEKVRSRKKNSSAETPLIAAPELNLSEGPGLYLDFIIEAREHLNDAENSLLACEQSGELPDESINSVFRAFHTIKGLSGFLQLADFQLLTHQSETMMDLVRKEELPMSGQIVDICLQVIDVLRHYLSLLQEQLETGRISVGGYPSYQPVLRAIEQAIATASFATKAEPVKPRLGEILLQQGVVSEKELEESLKLQQAGEKKRLGEILVERGAATPQQISQALEFQSRPVVTEQSIKINVRKLETLIDMVGELVIAGSQVIQNQSVQRLEDERLHKDMTTLGRIIREIQDTSLSMRLVPVKPMFQKMQRLVRDLSRSLGKNIDVRILGEETEIDKNMVDMVSDPLVHMVRNAVDHGIESDEERRRLGKPVPAMVLLSAGHRSGSVVISISDDGAGLNRDRIMTKAREKGLVSETDVLSEQRIYQLIFAPGFSTAQKVTDISGRGVGMDVVKRNIEQLRGRIEIQTTLGQGTTFDVKLPLTLAIIDGMLLQVGRERYVVPVSTIKEFFPLRTADITPVVGHGEVIRVHGKLYPLLRLKRIFNVRSPVPAAGNGIVCLSETDAGPVCMLVDAVLGQQQVVIKSLGEKLQQVKGLAGCTVLGDGRVGLILDVNDLARCGTEHPEDCHGAVCS